MSISASVPVVSERSRKRDFLQGFGLPFISLGVIFGSRRLLGLTALASLLTGTALVAVGVLSVEFAPRLTGWIWARPDSIAIVLWYALLAVVSVVLFAVGASTLPLLLAAPLQDPLSEATEVACGGFEPRPTSLAEVLRQTGAALAHTLLRIFWLLAGHAALLLLHMIPGVGQVAWTVGATLWTMCWLAAEYLDGPMTRHGYPFSAVRRAVWARLPLSLGFGAAVYLLLWIPILNFFFVPLAIVGGTLLFRGLRAAGALGEPALGR